MNCCGLPGIAGIASSLRRKRAAASLPEVWFSPDGQYFAKMCLLYPNYPGGQNDLTHVHLRMFLG
jgi:hypothetical protein